MSTLMVGNIRRINANTAPLSLDDFKTLKGFGIGTYQCFQETYHFETYMHMHPDGLNVITHGVCMQWTGHFKRVLMMLASVLCSD